MTLLPCIGHTNRTYCMYRTPFQIRGGSRKANLASFGMLSSTLLICISLQALWFTYFATNLSSLLLGPCTPHFHLSDIPPLSDSRSSLLIFSSRFEHILFRLWICFCKIRTIRNHQDTYSSVEVSKVNEQAFSSQCLCNQTQAFW